LLNDESLNLSGNDDQICDIIVGEARISFKGADKSDKMFRFKTCIMKAIAIEKKVGDYQAFIYILDNYFDGKSDIYRVLKDRFFPADDKKMQGARQLNLLENGAC
jgi:hypothetical protein